jgi:hypothetical protein
VILKETTAPSDAETIVRLADELANGDPDFHRTKGPGVGDLWSNAFIDALCDAVEERLGHRCSCEEPVIQDAKYAFDFFIPHEQTVVEVALGLRRPQSEFERDLFKVLLARGAGKDIRKLIFAGRPGSERKLNAAGPRAVRKFVQEKFGLDVEVREIGLATFGR